MRLKKLEMKNKNVKQRIRKEIKEQLINQNNARRLRKSLLIKEKFFKLAEFKKAEWVMFYIAKKEEVKTEFMITAALEIGKKIVVPVILMEEKRMIPAEIKDLKTKMTAGPYGVLQPQNGYIREVQREKIELVVVPGIAFDRVGNRLGRGGGYYDRFLSSLDYSVPRVGLAFDFQVLDSLPAFSHDIPVTKVISA